MRSAGFGLLIFAAAFACGQRARDLGVPFDGTPGPLDAITDVHRRGEAVDQRAVQIKECTDSWSWRTGGDLGNGIGGGEHRHRRHVDSIRYRVAVMYCECMKLSIFTSTSGGVIP